VSAWKVVFEGKYGKKFAKPEDHRALEDIRGSIMELEYYLKKVYKSTKSKKMREWLVKTAGDLENIQKQINQIIKAD
jgi:hypothetical protein